ncbi:Disease resistance protein [Nymphaea thermarum]|nr:Disease resistance protein [Nymphaea thermarum]
MEDSRHHPIAGCVAAILEWIKSAIDEALQSSWLSDSAIIPPLLDPVEVVERSSSPTVPLSPFPNEPHDFDIFLSFRGEDTRNGFTGHLCQALCGRGLKTFINNEDLHIGETIEEPFPYIERSKVFVSIISKGDVDSKWCLKEIAKMVECAGRRLIVPIFFGVEPSHVCHQAGPFQYAFKSYDNDKKVDKAEVGKWRDALKTVANNSSYILNDDANGHEATLVEKVVRCLLRHLESGLLIVADHPVGMESRIEDVMKLLQIKRDGVKMVGPVVTGGIGKTTIAKAVFNKLRSNFGAATFLTNIRERWKDASARTQLMRQLVEEILDDRFSQYTTLKAGSACS